MKTRTRTPRPRCGLCGKVLSKKELERQDKMRRTWFAQGVAIARQWVAEKSGEEVVRGELPPGLRKCR